MSTEV